MSMRVTVGCKVNLSLRITSIRSDGYHEIDSVFWPLSIPNDVLEITPTTTPGIQITCSTAYIDPTRNTLTKAYAAYCAATRYNVGLQIVLHKGIPHGAGLGGGSADAAAVLQYCNQHCPQPLGFMDLQHVATSVGADVPFFLHNRPCHVQGIGEIIQPYLDSRLAHAYAVVACPALHISTPWAFATWDAINKNFFLQERLTTSTVRDKHRNSCRELFYNDLEPVVFDAHPELAGIKMLMQVSGSMGVVMSGSGSSIVGVYNLQHHAHAVVSKLREQGIQVFCAEL